MKDKLEQAFEEAWAEKGSGTRPGPSSYDFALFKAGAEWAQKNRTAFLVKDLTDLYPSEVFGLCFVLPAVIALVVMLLKLLF